MKFRGMEAIASPYTTMVYEQQFHTSLIADYYGKIDLTGGDDTGFTWVPAEVIEARLSAAASAAKAPKAFTNNLHKVVSAAFPARVANSVDYTQTRWDAILRVLWAMLRTGQALAAAEGRPAEAVPPFNEWLLRLGPVDMNALDSAVFEETQRGLFRADDADGGKAE